MVVRSGEFVKKFLESSNGDISPDAVQPAGVDISIGSIEKVSSVAVLTDGDDYDKGDRSEVPSHTRKSYDQRGKHNANEYLRRLQVSISDPREWYLLDSSEDSYIIKYAETIEIPEGHVGLVVPRSRLMRAGADIVSALWDPGYKGKGEGQLVINNPQGLVLEAGMRVGQLFFIKTEDLSASYDGTHQGEGL